MEIRPADGSEVCVGENSRGVGWHDASWYKKVVDESDHPSDEPGDRHLPSFVRLPSLAIGIIGVYLREKENMVVMLKLELSKRCGRGLSARLPTTHPPAPERGKLTAHFARRF